ncbi:hypothetical protein OF83DRAFT_1180689 [Amylostereum chailletii]|nr:hypothetical protein OF83DRAFT_1180689 [Amylostereum chailletii]
MDQVTVHTAAAGLRPAAADAVAVDGETRDAAMELGTRNQRTINRRPGPSEQPETVVLHPCTRSSSKTTEDRTDEEVD